MDSRYKYRPRSYARALCFHFPYCDNGDCAYRHYQLPQDRPSYEQQRRYEEKMRLSKIKHTAQIHETVKKLRLKYPNFDKKIETNSLLYIEEKTLRHNLHLLKMHLNKDGHIDYYAGVCCNIECGDFYLQSFLGQKISYGKKHREKTWKQVEKVDPQYIDWIFRTFAKDDIKQNIAEHIIKRRPYKKNEQFQVRKALSDKNPSFDGKHSEKTWEQIEKENPQYIDFFYRNFAGSDSLEKMIAMFIVKRRAQLRKDNEQKVERQKSRSRSRQKERKFHQNQ